MRPVSEAVARVSRETTSRKFIALGRILQHWNDIVGDKLADKAQPIKIHYRGSKKQRGASPDATLEIATASAYATQLHYQKDLILERINQIFGERWITAIRFVSVPANEISPTSKNRPPARLSRQDQKYLEEALEKIEDPDIRDKLLSLGLSMLEENA